MLAVRLDTGVVSGLIRIAQVSPEAVALTVGPKSTHGPTTFVSCPVLSDRGITTTLLLRRPRQGRKGTHSFTMKHVGLEAIGTMPKGRQHAALSVGNEQLASVIPLDHNGWRLPTRHDPLRLREGASKNLVAGSFENVGKPLTFLSGTPRKSECGVRRTAVATIP